MTTLSAARPIEPMAVHPLRPLPVWQAVILFAVPAAAMALAVYGLWPALTGVGLRKVDGRFLVSSLVMAGLVVVALAAYLLEGRPLTWTAFANRFRLGRMSGRAWLWTITGLLVMGVLSLTANLLLPTIWRAMRFTPPEAYVEAAPALWFTMVNLALNILGRSYGGAVTSCRARSCSMAGGPG